MRATILIYALVTVPSLAACGGDVFFRFACALAAVAPIPTRTNASTTVALERDEDLFAMYANRAGSFDPDAHLVAADVEHGHHDVVANHDALIRATCEHEHGVLPPLPLRECTTARVSARNSTRALEDSRDVGG